MINYKTISFYLFKLYFRQFLIISLVLIGILALSNAFDVLQKFKTGNVPSRFFWKLVLYKIPYLINEIAALISFISMLFFLRRISRHNELIILLCSGISIWRIIAIPAISSIFLGILMVGLINPIGVYGLQKYEQLEGKLTNKKLTNLSIIHSGILFAEEYKNSKRIVQARSIHLATKKLKDVTILFIDDDNNFLKRIDANTAILTDGAFNLLNSKSTTGDNSEKHLELLVPTSLSISAFTESSVSPEMVSVWNLPNSINKFLKSGLPIINYQIYYYKQLFKPLLMMATIFLASCFITLRHRDSHEAKMLAAGLVLGVLAYSVIEILLRVLAYSGTQPALAILLPIFLMILISNFVVLHLYEA